MDARPISRRDAFALILAAAQPSRPIVVSVQALFDGTAHGGRGLDAREISLFHSYQEKARRDYAVSGIHFDLHTVEGAYLRSIGSSIIAEKFLLRNMINLFVTTTLSYDIDRDRTGGASMGPRPASRRAGAYPFYQTFFGLQDAHDSTLEHEYAHHFTLDTRRKPTTAGNFWADLRNDYWLWRQRHGAPVPEFRACSGSPWAS